MEGQIYTNAYESEAKTLESPSGNVMRGVGVSPTQNPKNTKNTKSLLPLKFPQAAPSCSTRAGRPRHL
jgi:hypothetical protein